MCLERRRFVCAERSPQDWPPLGNPSDCRPVACPRPLSPCLCFPSPLPSLSLSLSPSPSHVYLRFQYNFSLPLFANFLAKSSIDHDPLAALCFEFDLVTYSSFSLPCPSPYLPLPLALPLPVSLSVSLRPLGRCSLVFPFSIYFSFVVFF